MRGQPCPQLTVVSGSRATAGYGVWPWLWLGRWVQAPVSSRKGPCALVFLSPSAQLIIPALVAVTQVMHNFLAFTFPVMVAGCSMAVLYLLPW